MDEKSLILPNEEAEKRVRDIEAEGYSFTGEHTETLTTAKDVVGPFGSYEPANFEKMQGEQIRILTFEKEEQKRYCILDQENKVINMPLSRLRFRSEYNESMLDHEDMNRAVEFSEEFKKRGFDISPAEAFSSFKVHEGKSIAEEVDKIIEDTTLGYRNYPVYEAMNPGYKLEHELLECGQNRQGEALGSIAPDVYYQGRNSSEELGIVKTSQKVAAQAELKRMAKEGQAISAEYARLLGVEEQAVKQLEKDIQNVEALQDADRMSEELLAQHLAAYEAEVMEDVDSPLIVKYHTRPPHPEVVSIATNAFRANRDKINPLHLNRNLQRIANRIRKSGKAVGADPEQISKATKNVLNQYLVEDYQRGVGLQELLDKFPTHFETKEDRLMAEHTIDAAAKMDGKTLEETLRKYTPDTIRNIIREEKTRGIVKEVSSSKKDKDPKSKEGKLVLSEDIMKKIADNPSTPGKHHKDHDHKKDRDDMGPGNK